MNNLVYGIENIIYGSNDNHKLLIDDSIGKNGENLTIMILSCNRVDATIQLLDSAKEHLKGFLGEILIIDNNSSLEELKILKKYLSKYEFKNNIIEMKENYGVAGGRNRGIDYVNTEWVLSLDNDIYFIDNPLEDIDNSIKLLGCHFLNIPLLNEDGTKYFLNGGQIYVDYDGQDCIIGGGSMFKQSEITEYELDKPSLSTFFCGGSSVFKKSSFIKLNKYDEGYFIGFEDTDLSIRLFKEGYKVGNSTKSCLIHNHVIKKDQNSKNYEKKRFSSQVLYESARHFEEKWGFKVWNKNLEMWLQDRQKSLGINEEKLIIEKTKKKIALVVDVYDWCFYNISTKINEYLKAYFDFEIIVMTDFENIYDLFFYIKDFDLVHFFWRGHLLWLNSNDYSFITTYGMTYRHFLDNIVSPLNITTSVYDHLFLDEELDKTKTILSYAKNYTVSSNILNKIYSEIDDIKKPYMTITDGVDTHKFKKINKNKYKNILKRKLVLGWVGNSAWNSDEPDYKGFNTIIKPAIEELMDEGLQIETYFADKQENPIPFDEMPKYYNKIDILICASKAEGTPNPVLEAMASGTIVISTNVGIVPEIMNKKQKKYILKERNKDELKRIIKLAYKNRAEFDSISNENVKLSQIWDWKHKCNLFKKFFEKNLKVGKK